MPQPAADLLQVLLGLVKQTVQTHGRIAMSGRSEWSKAKTYVESRLPHGTVALVVIGTQFEFALFAIDRRHGRRNVAHLLHVGSSGNLLRRSRQILHNVIVRLSGMKEEIRSYLAIETSFILHDFGRRALPQIVVTRQAGVAREMRREVPHVIIFLEISISSRHASLIFLS